MLILQSRGDRMKYPLLWSIVNCWVAFILSYWQTVFLVAEILEFDCKLLTCKLIAVLACVKSYGKLCRKQPNCNLTLVWMTKKKTPRSRSLWRFCELLQPGIETGLLRFLYSNLIKELSITAATLHLSSLQCICFHYFFWIGISCQWDPTHFEPSSEHGDTLYRQTKSFSNLSCVKQVKAWGLKKSGFENS